jgi:N-acetylmuramoyl-L-alanine amidase
MAAGAGEWTTLDRLAQGYGWRAPVAQGTQVVLRHPFHRAVFDAGSRRMTFDGVVFYLNGSVVRHGYTWLVGMDDATEVLSPLFDPIPALRGVRQGPVVLDAGHGGDDPGARGGGGLDEERLTLDLARKVRARLNAAGVEVVLTRDRDVAVSLQERSARANRARAGVFVSIHLNAARDRRTAGVETYVVPSAGAAPTSGPEGVFVRGQGTAWPVNRYDAANTVLGYCVHRGLLAASQAPDRGIRRARFMVIKNVTCPAVLVECGFLSHRPEAERLGRDEYRAVLAEGIARGILTYLSRQREANLPPVYTR